MVEESNKMILAGGGYSLEEQVIGTWINGKPLYQRSYYIDDLRDLGLSNNSNVYLVVDIGNVIDNLNDIDVIGIPQYYIYYMEGGNKVVKRYDRFVAFTQTNTPTGSFFWVYLQSVPNDVNIFTGKRVSLYITLQYIKTNE